MDDLFSCEHCGRSSPKSDGYRTEVGHFCSECHDIIDRQTGGVDSILEGPTPPSPQELKRQLDKMTAASEAIDAVRQDEKDDVGEALAQLRAIRIINERGLAVHHGRELLTAGTGRWSVGGCDPNKSYAYGDSPAEALHHLDRVLAGLPYAEYDPRGAFQIFQCPIIDRLRLAFFLLENQFRRQSERLRSASIDGAVLWMNDGVDILSDLHEDQPVLIAAGDLREMLQRAEGAIEVARG